MLPFGEHKGYGIALMIDILCGILSGASYGRHLGPLWNNSETHQNLGFFLFAINIAIILRCRLSSNVASTR